MYAHSRQLRVHMLRAWACVWVCVHAWSRRACVRAQRSGRVNAWMVPSAHTHRLGTACPPG